MKNLLQKHRYMTTLALAAVLIGGLGVTSAYAFSGNGQQNLTDEQKTALTQIHDLRDAGNLEEARALAESVGLPARGARTLKGGFADTPHRQAVEDALAAHDYQAFLTATADAPFTQNITEDVFVKMAEAYTLREAGDFTAARAIMDELDIHQHGPRFEKGKHRMNALTDVQKNGLEQARALHDAGKIDEAKALIESLNLPFKPGPHR